MDLREAALHDVQDGARHPWELARIEVVRALLHDHAPRAFEPGAVILDVGCGDTFVIESLALTMPHARFLAVDPAFSDTLLARYAARHAERAAPVRVARRLEEVLPGLERGVDCVLLLDVVEHVEDDVALLAELRTRPEIGPGARWLITVPAYAWLLSAHDAFLGHHRRYDRTLLTDHARAAGLRPLATGHFFASLVAARLVVKLAEALGRRPQPTGIGAWRGPRAIGWLYRAALLTDFAVTRALARLGIVLPGLSTWAVCARSA